MQVSQGSHPVCSFCRIPDDCLFTTTDIRSRARRALEWRFYDKGSTVFSQDDPVAGIFVIQSGWVALFARGAAGRRVAIGIRGPGAMLGLSEVLESSTYLTTAETGDDTEFEFLPVRQLLEWLELSAAFRAQVLRTVARENRQLMNQLLDAGQLSADQKLSKILAELARSSAGPAGDRTDARFSVSVTHLSQHIGCSRQWTSRLLAALERSGALRRESGWIIVPGSQIIAPRRKRRARQAGGSSA